jgi:hypothetical protein
MTLADYIREIGPEEFARRFNIKPRTACSYMYGDRRPRPDLAERIVNETPVDWHGVYAAQRSQADAT